MTKSVGGGPVWQQDEFQASGYQALFPAPAVSVQMASVGGCYSAGPTQWHRDMPSQSLVMTRPSSSKHKVHVVEDNHVGSPEVTAAKPTGMTTGCLTQCQGPSSL